jgi:polyhydroxyalkanoate synthesis regulator protein
MKNLKMMAAVVLKTLGLTAFGKNTDGKEMLTEEQKATLASMFGDNFSKMFSKALEEGVTASVDNQEETPQESSTAEGLMNALRDHHSTVVASQLSDLQAQLKQANKEKQNLQNLVNAMSDETEANPSAEFPKDFERNPKVQSVMKVDMNAAHYAAAKTFVQTGSAGAVPKGATIEVADLKTEFGKYLNINGNNLDIIKQLFTGFTSSQYFTSVLATTEYRAIRALITSVVQQFSAKWTPLGKAKFTPIKIINRRHKINYPIIPAEVLDSYMFKLYDEGLAPDQMPITKYIWNELLYPQILNDIELRMIFKGKYVEHTGDTATPPEDGMDGLETILVEAKASGTSNIPFFNKYPNYDYRTATDQEVLNFFNDFVAWISPLYAGVSMNIYVSPEHLSRYQAAYKNKWGQNSGQDGDFGTKRIDFSNKYLVALDGMYASPIVFSTPKANMLKPRHKNEVPNVINDVQKHDYEVRLYGEFWLSVGFAIEEAVFAFVPAGYNPKAQITRNWGAYDTYQDWKYADDETGSGSTAGGI